MATLTRDNGLLQKATTAKAENEQAKELELIKLAVSAAQVSGEGTITKDNLENELKINFNDNTITIGEIEDGWSYNSYKIDKSGEVDKLLPKEYKQVEYIESSGTQYIDTRIKLKDDLYSAELGFQSTRKMQRNWILAVWYKSGWQCAQTNERFVDENGFRYSQNNDLMAYTVAISDKNTVKDIPITVRLFGQLDEFGVEKFGYYKLFYCKIFYANNYLRNYVPCYSTTTVADVDGEERSAGTVGLYDTVNGQFYANQGTGTFGYGMEDGTYVAPQND